MRDLGHFMSVRRQQAIWLSGYFHLTPISSSEITPDSDYAQAVRAGGYKIWTEVDRLSGAFAIVKYVGRMRGWSVMQLDKAMV